MYKRHNPLMEILSDEKVCPDDMSTRNCRHVFLQPYMTIETFSRHGPRVLRLLYLRAAPMLDERVPFDNRQLHTGWSVGALEENSSRNALTSAENGTGEFALLID